MTFGLPLPDDRPAPAGSGPGITYQHTDGATTCRADEQPPNGARERAVCRALLVHAITLIDSATDHPED